MHSGVPLERQNLIVTRPSGLNPRSRVDRPYEATNHEAGAGNEDNGECDFGRNEGLAAAPRKRTCLTRAARERRSDLHTREPDRRHESEDKRGRHEQRRRRGEHGQVQADGSFSGSLIGMLATMASSDRRARTTPTMPPAPARTMLSVRS